MGLLTRQAESVYNQQPTWCRLHTLTPSILKQLTFLLYGSHCLFGELEHNLEKNKWRKGQRQERCAVDNKGKKIHGGTKQVKRKKKKKGGGRGQCGFGVISAHLN